MPCGAIVAFFGALFIFMLKSLAGVENTTSSLSVLKAQFCTLVHGVISGRQ